jgi:hypothetical protein
MKIKAYVLATVMLMAFSFGWAAIKDAEKIDAKIKLAGDLLLAKQPSDKDCKDGFLSLVEAIALAAPNTSFPAVLGEKVIKAESLFKTTSIFNQEGVALLNECFVLAHSGKKFSVPAEITSIATAAEYSRRQLQAARAQNQQGKADECAKILIEIAVMIVTPMTAD